MASTARRRTVAVSVLAPLSAYALSVAVDWAITHDPTGGATDAARAKPSEDPRVSTLRAEIRHATKGYKADRHRLLKLQREIGDRSRQVQAQRAANAARLAAAVAQASTSEPVSSGGSTYVPPASSGGGQSGQSPAPTAGPAPAPPPPPPPPPAPPPTQTTTGASG